MLNRREEYFDEAAKVRIILADVTDAAQRLAAGHLCGPTSAHFLAEGLAAVALLGAETSAPDEVVSLQMKCAGPLGGLCVECTAQGTLRGYTERKVLDDFDGLGTPDPRRVVGEKQIQVTRSVPGRILSQGVAASLDGYLAQSLQRRAAMRVEAAVSDAVEILEARGVMVEAMPDAPGVDGGILPPTSLRTASRSLLKRLGHEHAVLKKTTPLAFACRCSPERAAAMLAALSPDERAALPESLDITCHMCGRTWSVKTR